MPPEENKKAGQNTAQAQPAPAKPAQQEDDVVGKAYDSRLMKRLLTYLFPYK